MQYFSMANGVPKIGMVDLLRLMEEHSVTVVNVLGREAYENLRIAGSVWIPFDILEERGWEMLDKERPVVTYCASSSCGASLTAAAILREHGIDASAYEGGIKEWAEAGLPVEGKLQYSDFYRAGKC
jgi:rhodanese-related sulfurtransferase